MPNHPEFCQGHSFAASSKAFHSNSCTLQFSAFAHVLSSSESLCMRRSRCAQLAANACTLPFNSCSDWKSK
jgi:hypothetical protein